MPPAEDITAQVFLEALEGLPHYQEDGHFAARLFTIARRRAVDHYRRILLERRSLPALQGDEAAEESTEINPGAEDPLAQIIHSEDLDCLAEAVAALGDYERELLRLRFAGDLPFAKIAALLGCKESAVKMSYYRLLERLQHQLEARDE